MILSKSDVDNRLSSEDNLINRLRLTTRSIPTESMSLFIPGNDEANKKSENENLAVPVPTVDDLMEDAEGKITESLTAKAARDVLYQAVEELRNRLSEVERPESLSKIVKDMNEVLCRKSDSVERTNNNPQHQQVVIWKPVVVNNHYEEITVSE